MGEIMNQELLSNYLFYKANEKEHALSVVIELLTSCNLKCKHCYIPDHTKSSLNFDKVKSILYELHNMGVLYVTFTGGEIFLRDDLLELIEIARNLHLRVILLSNGTLLNKQIINKLSQLFITEFSTTIFSMNENIHDYITESRGSLKQVLYNLQLLKDAGIRVKVKTPLMGCNKEEFRDINKYCKLNNFEYGVTANIFEKKDGNQSPVHMRIPQSDLSILLREIDIHNRNLNIRKLDYSCSALKFMFSIDVNGDIYPCNSFDYKVGNVYNEKIYEVWNKSEDWIRIRNIKKSDLKKCIECVYNKNCDRCPGMAYKDCCDIYGCDGFAKSLAQIRTRWND